MLGYFYHQKKKVWKYISIASKQLLILIQSLLVLKKKAKPNYKTVFWSGSKNPMALKTHSNYVRSDNEKGREKHFFFLYSFYSREEKKLPSTTSSWNEIPNVWDTECSEC